MRRHLTPPQILAISFALLILSGTGLLALPVSHRGEGLTLLDALFTATSAVCVTGLTVVDTADTFSGFGRAVVLMLIQLGGFGWATFSTFTALLLGRRIGLRERKLLAEAFNQSELQGLVRLARYILGVTAVFELTGALLMALVWIPQHGWAMGFWLGLFHAVSAFNNAGFDLMGGFRSLVGQSGWVLAVVAALIVCGGIGFGVIADLQRSRRWADWTLHTRLVLLTTLGLIVGGTVTLLAVEWGGPAWGDRSFLGQLGLALFHSISARTAGFAAADIGQLRAASLLVLVVLMFIGASPNSTGGGIKTTTFAALVLTVRSAWQQREETVAMEHRLPLDVVQRAGVIAFLSASWVIAASFLLMLTDPQIAPLRLIFEATSAFGTVGLSTGITPELSAGGRLILITTMYFGRVGLLTLLLALSRTSPELYRYPEGRISVG